MRRRTEQFEVPGDAVYPRDAEHRYRLYARRGEELRVIACASSPAALGTMIVALDDDQAEHGSHLYEMGAIGVLDAVEERWIILPWPRAERAATVGPPPTEIR